MGSKNFREYAAFSSETAGVAGDRVLGALGLSDLEHYNHLTAMRCTVEGGDEAIGITDAFEKQCDDGSVLVVDEMVDIIDGGNGCFVARRHH
jgi:hypothetical protein